MSNTFSLDSWLGLSEQNNTITITDDSEPEARKIGGQYVVIQGNSVYVHIREGPWITAGKEFNWPRKFGMPGFSINKHIVDFADGHKHTIRIINSHDRDRCYEITTNVVMEFIEEYNSIDDKRGARLYVVPWRIFRTLHQNVTSIVQLFHAGDA